MAIDGVSRELVEEARAGIYVEPEDAEEYSKAIREYLNDDIRLQTEGQNGYQYAKNNFDREFLAKKYLKSIEQIIR